jgi:hypothetical protein
MFMHFLDFEQPIIEIEAKIRDLSLLGGASKEVFSLKIFIKLGLGTLAKEPQRKMTIK